MGESFLREEGAFFFLEPLGEGQHKNLFCPPGVIAILGGFSSGIFFLPPFFFFWGFPEGPVFFMGVQRGFS